MKNRSERDTRIRQEFDKMHKQGYRNEVIAEKLSARFYLAEDTILAIALRRGRYKHDSSMPQTGEIQLKLF